MATVVNQFMYVFNFGLGDSTINGIAVNRENLSAVNQVFTRNFGMALIIGFLCLILGISVSLSGLLNNWFHVPTDLVDQTNLTLCFAFSSTSIKFSEIVLLSVFKGFERFDISSKLSLLSRNTVILVNLLLAIYGFSLVYIFLSTIIINVFNIIVQLLVLNKHFNDLDLKPLLTLKHKEMDNRKFWYWLQSVIGLIGFLSDKFLVGYFTNIKILGLYSIASLIGSQLHNAFSSIGNFMFPRVANMKSNDEDVSQLYFNSRFVIASLSLFVNLILVIVGPWIFNWWLGPETYNQNAEIINLYLVYISLLSLCIIPYQFINASRNLRFNSFFELFLRITHIVSMLLGFYVHGLSGLIYGLIISTLLALPFEYYFFQKYFFKINSVLRALEVVLPFIGFITFVFFGNFYFSCVSLIFILISFYFIYIRKINLIDWKK